MRRFSRLYKAMRGGTGTNKYRSGNENSSWKKPAEEDSAAEATQQGALRLQKGAPIQGNIGGGRELRCRKPVAGRAVLLRRVHPGCEHPAADQRGHP